MELIIGLGNPGKKYESSRHNAGFMAVDKIREYFSTEGGPASGWEFNKKFNADISEVIIDGKKIILVKPQTFMNLSGEAVKKILDFYKLTPADIIVIHDDLDIDLGKYKISADSSSAGHQGVQSIIDRLGTQKFKRIRIGIEGEERRKNRLVPSDEFVLQKFTEKEITLLESVLDAIPEKILKLLQ